MKVFVINGTNDRVRVNVDAELFEKEVDVGVELGLTALAEEDKDLASVLDKVLEGGRKVRNG